MIEIFLAVLFIVGITAYYAIRNFRKQNTIKKKQRDLDDAYNRLTREQNFCVKYLDRFNQKIIGLDSKNKKLLFIDHSKKERKEACLSLLNVGSCHIIEVEDGQQESTRKILLKLKEKNQETVFCFFDDSYDAVIDMPALMRRARFWKQRIELHKYLGNVTLELEYVL